MVYGLLYLPREEHISLLADSHRFDDSKVLTPEVRSALMKTLCTPNTDLHDRCGWATRVMSARDISAGMLKPAGTYNLNAQAMDATIQLIRDVFEKGVNVKEIYIDTIGNPATYQKKLERIFPTTSITVAKKADSLYPCVSAASVCAKVSRDVALEVSHRFHSGSNHLSENWGSGYPSDTRATTWMKNNVDPFFGWGSGCRFSWSTAKDLLESKLLTGNIIDWPVVDDEPPSKVTDFLSATSANLNECEKITTWFGTSVPEVMM